MAPARRRYDFDCTFGGGADTRSRFLPRDRFHHPFLGPSCGQLAEVAEADYDAEIAALDGLPLDDDEREVLICAAKQRLIRKLNQNE